MKKNGFTLIELLSVIVIISIIAIITTVNVFNYINSTKDEISNNDKSAIISAAKNWSADNPDLLPGESSNIYYTLNVSTLIDEGYLSHDADKYKDYHVTINYQNNKYIYSIQS